MLNEISTLDLFLIFSACLFCIGFYAAIARKNLVLMLIGIELMVNAALINLIAFDQLVHHNEEAEIAGIFIMVLSAASLALAFAIAIRIYKLKDHIQPDKLRDYKN